MFGWLPYNEAGSIAEEIRISERFIVHKPRNLTFVEAAALPMGCLAALTALEDYGGLRHDMKILINGSTGGVGQLAVMIAKIYGCTLTGICSNDSMDIAFKIGTDYIVDYNKFNILESDQKFDIIMDNVGNLKFKEAKRLLTKFGVFLEMNETLFNFIFAPIRNKFSLQKIQTIATKESASKLERIITLPKDFKIQHLL